MLCVQLNSRAANTLRLLYAVAGIVLLATLSVMTVWSSISLR